MVNRLVNDGKNPLGKVLTSYAKVVVIQTVETGSRGGAMLAKTV